MHLYLKTFLIIINFLNMIKVADKKENLLLSLIQPL